MASTSPALLSLIPIVPTMGACLIGVYLSSVFYGVTLLQTYQYFYRYWGRDKLYIYSLVVLLTILDSLSTIANMYSMWYYLIEHYGNPIVILAIHWTLTMSISATAVIEFLVKVFYAYRLWILGGRKLYFLPGIIIIFGLVALVGGIAYVVLITKNGSLLYLPKITWLLLSAFSFSLVADFLIASSMTYLLLKGRNRGLKSTDNLLRKLVTYTISTGLLTVICTLMALILAQVYKHTFYDVMFYFPLSKCYINSMLAFLNVRDSLRGNNTNMISVNLRATGSSRDRSTQDFGSSSEVRSKIERSQKTSNAFPAFNTPEDATVQTIHHAV
ncbi:unnamed protein product [Cyclocybe aegerita]|uniref:DUF6534 domain-containing protein n=1 Tax=Cyclocybe aegerita TaxID=1973307 RepID=A0A8S0VUX1_CYCAE|nr:unnamed protein product [Cyclocybe aegerita]